MLFYATISRFRVESNRFNLLETRRYENYIALGAYSCGFAIS
jgi:hypothetical protein